ncbi:hypothetical protein LEN26_017898 [Aphanomyces euteiches]|nr:hypothetical protein LEN26_017898 [Aphanomyces euteiches]KAH9124322.1 hypothetical protein AeMF1_004893 [Aphanomyces euteiches]KAH9185369.1 hypothetical protein AeNC1_012656 [Aphanomyces euteiches]
MVPFLSVTLSLFGMGEYATYHATHAASATTGVMQVSLMALSALNFDPEDQTFKKIIKSAPKTVATVGAVSLSFLGLGCLVEIANGYSPFMGAAVTTLGFGGIRNYVLPYIAGENSECLFFILLFLGTLFDGRDSPVVAVEVASVH